LAGFGSAHLLDSNKSSACNGAIRARLLAFAFGAPAREG
jgi:hypothetical protein